MNRWIFLFLGMLVLGFPDPSYAQTRTWAFSKDTVYGSNFRVDTVRVTNSGVDTLRFDSLHLELARPTATRYKTVFYPVPRTGQTEPYVASYDTGHGLPVRFRQFGHSPQLRTISCLSQDKLIMVLFYKAGSSASCVIRTC